MFDTIITFTLNTVALISYNKSNPANNIKDRVCRCKGYGEDGIRRSFVNVGRNIRSCKATAFVTISGVDRMNARVINCHIFVNKSGPAGADVFLNRSCVGPACARSFACGGNN